MALIVLIIGWRKASRPFRSSLSTPLAVTVIVPFRNEGANILAAIESLSHQTYKNFEIIAVNDHSHDDAAEKLRHDLLPNLKVVDNVGEGKKMAITTGVKLAKGQVIITTDADCSFPRRWIETMVERFADAKVEMVFGPVKLLQRGGLFSDMQSIEFSSLIGSAAALAGLGTPVMCNGASLAYRRKTFLDLNGYEGNLNVPSGDDEFLMRKILTARGGSVRYAGNDSVVTTSPKVSVKDLFSQRLRWAAKWKYNSSVMAIAVAMVVVSVQIAWLVQITMVFIHPISTAACLTLVLKLTLEYCLLRMVSNGLKVKWSTPAFLLLQFTYPIYVLAVGIASNFVSYSWKERKIQ